MKVSLVIIWCSKKEELLFVDDEIVWVPKEKKKKILPVYDGSDT
jgi:hypothetical protein